jgi:site-specific DNA recombinase
MNESHKKAIGYIRISSIRQVDNESPETQRDVISRYAESQGIDIIEWFFDEAKSGKNADRAELQKLLTFAAKYKGRIDHVIVYNMRRASRDLESYTTQVRMLLQARGITMRSATEPVDDTKMGRFMENFLVLMGQLDNEGKAEVTIDNMKALAEQGYWQHPPIVGYEVTKINNERGKPRPSLKKSKMADKVQMVLERFSVGDMTKAELTRYAESVGLRSRYNNVMSEDSINRLVKSPTYAGFVSDKLTGYELVQGMHPAIISPAIFERNQALLHGKNSRKGENHSKANRDYPLRGLVLCMNCEQPLYASAPRTGNGKKSPRYHCARSSCRGKVKSVRASIVHDEFFAMLHSLRPSDGVLRLYKNILVKEANASLDNLNIRIKTKRDKLDEISKLRSATVKKFIEGSVSQQEKDEFITDLDAQKLEVKTELETAEQQQTIREVDIEQAINFMENVDRQWEISDYDIKQRFQSMLFPRGLTYDSVNGRFGTSEISPLYRYVVTKKDLPEPEKSFLVAGAGLEPATLWL